MFITIATGSKRLCLSRVDPQDKPPAIRVGIEHFGPKSPRMATIDVPVDDLAKALNMLGVSTRSRGPT